MYLTKEEAEERKAYCGTCKYWRLYKEGECEEYQKEYAFKDGVTREQCATKERHKMPCLLGLCTIRNEGNFCDEMYAGDYGEKDDCFDWEPYVEGDA